MNTERWMSKAEALLPEVERTVQSRDDEDSVMLEEAREMLAGAIKAGERDQLLIAVSYAYACMAEFESSQEKLRELFQKIRDTLRSW
jgi:hypothetical protein